MQIIRWAGVAISIALAAGCAPKPPPPAPPPVEPTPTPQAAAMMRQSILQSDSGARVGQVKAVLPEKNYVAVGDIPVRDFSEGQVIQIIGGNMNVVAIGRVVTMDADHGLLVVEYQPNMKRMPEVGDLAVRMTDRSLPLGAHVDVNSAGSGGGTAAPPPVTTPPPSGTAAPSQPPTATPTATPAGGADATSPKPADAPKTSDTPKPEEQKKPAAPAPAEAPAATGDKSPPTDAAAPKPADFNK